MTEMSVAADKACETSLDSDLIGTIALRLILPVGRVEADHLTLAAESLECRLRLVDQRDDDLAFTRCVDLADEREIAIENAFLDHRIAGHLERIMLPRAKQRCRNREILLSLERLDRRA